MSHADRTVRVLLAEPDQETTTTPCTREREPAMPITDVKPINEGALIPLPVKQDTPAATTLDNYAAVRFNALKHGILSKLTVLAHEDQAAFDAMLAALIEEHQPCGMTELHLVEELAAIMWRQRRVLLAEGAAINRGLYSVVHSQCDSPLFSAAPFESGLKREGTDLPDLLTADAREIAERRRTAALDLAATRRAAAILRKGGARAYQKARQALLQDSRDWWDEQVAEEEYPATVEGLTQFIHNTLEPIGRQLEQEARLIPAIQVQTLGEGLQAHRLEKLNRYETHLDRKFERTLSMLLKLKQLRRA